MQFFAYILLDFKRFQKAHTQTQHNPFHTKNNLLKVTMHVKIIIQNPQKHFYYHKRVLQE